MLQSFNRTHLITLIDLTSARVHNGSIPFVEWATSHQKPPRVDLHLKSGPSNFVQFPHTSQTIVFVRVHTIPTVPSIMRQPNAVHLADIQLTLSSQATI